MAEKNGFRRARTGRGTEALTARKSDVMARKAAAEAHISDQLNTFTLGGDEAATATSVSTISNPIHIQEENFDHLDTMNTINDALFRSDGGIIPGTGAVKLSPSVTDANRTTWFQPNPGEVWIVDMAGFVWVDKTGDAGVTMYYYDGTTALDVAYLNNTATGALITARFSDDGSWEWPFHLDENCYIQFVAGSASNWASGQFQGACWRIR